MSYISSEYEKEVKSINKIGFSPSSTNPFPMSPPDLIYLLSGHIEGIPLQYNTGHSRASSHFSEVVGNLPFSLN